MVERHSVLPYRFTWTNQSVLKFAKGNDPVALIEAKSRELVLRALDAGWSGPPYNPLKIADLLKIPVEANVDIADARTVSGTTGVKIEFNPTRPRERVRFSIAHEIAHTLFPDVAEKPRHRSGPESSPDEWQLEMLCNLAAAELVMPIGSLPAANHIPAMEELMKARREFDVSAEAFLIRIIKTATEPALMFCASPIEREGQKPTYRIEYCIGSKSSPVVMPSGTSIPADSVVNTCTAIGQTSHASENWVTGRKSSIDCVGIPGYVGANYPRVACVVRFGGSSRHMDALNFVHGDVLKSSGRGPKVICQLVNDQARVWGGGVARSAAKKYPAAQQQFGGWLIQLAKKDRLGQVHFADVGESTIIASLIAQEGFGASPTPRIRYAALSECFLRVADFATAHEAAVHLPRVGAGQSGGSWDTVEEIIRDTLVARGVRVTVHDLPPKRQPEEAARLI